MNITVFSFISATLWFSIFILISTLLRRKTGFLLQYRLLPLTVVIAAALLRLFASFDLSFSIVVPSVKVLPAVYTFLTRPLLIAGIGYSLRVLDLFLIVWLAVAAILVIRLCALIYKGYRICSSLVCIEDSRVEGLMRSISPARDYRLMISPQISTPSIIGFFRPTVILPDCITEFGDRDVEGILRHEMQHFAHHDQWLKLVISLVCALLWWNPLVYLLKIDLDQLLEINCDLYLTGSMSDEDKLHYSESLVEILRRSEGKTDPSLAVATGFAFFSSSDMIKQRLNIILSHNRPIRRRTQWAALLIMIPLLIFSFSFIVQPRYDAPETEPGLIESFPESAYILHEEDGSYTVFYDGNHSYTVTNEQAIRQLTTVLNVVEYNEKDG